VKVQLDPTLLSSEQLIVSSGSGFIGMQLSRMHLGVVPVQPPSAVHSRVLLPDMLKPGRQLKLHSEPHSSPIEQCFLPFKGFSKGVH
jgi:hypothetical protein